MRIRRATQEDVNNIVELAAVNFPNSHIFIRPEDEVLVAEINNCIVGFLHITRIKNNAVIKGLCVAPKFRRKGIGSALMKVALATLKKETGIHLKVKAGNAQAINLYEKHGFFLKKFGAVHILVRKKPN